MKVKLVPIVLAMVMIVALAMAHFNLRVWVYDPYPTNPIDSAYVSVTKGGTKYDGYTNRYGYIWFYNLEDGTWNVHAGKIGLIADTTVTETTGNIYIHLDLHFPD